MEIDIQYQRSNDENLGGAFNKVFRKTMLGESICVISRPRVIVINRWIKFLAQIKLPFAQYAVAE
jgi:hypothetical protein